MSYKLVSIEYTTTEEAAAVAAQLNAACRGGSVRVRTEGRTLEVLSANASVADVFGMFVKFGMRIVGFSRHWSDTGHATDRGLPTS